MPQFLPKFDGPKIDRMNRKQGENRMKIRSKRVATITRNQYLSTAPLALFPNTTPRKGLRGGRSAIFAAAAAGIALGANMASAHTDALGYLVSDGSAAGLFDVQIVYGSWHGGVVSAEGAVQLNRADNSTVGTQAFAILLSNASDGTLPSGLMPGQNFFYISSDGNSLVATDSAGNGVYNFQAATFTDISAGTYTFAYASTSGLTQVWTPAGDAISSGTFTVTSSGGVTVPGQASDIDTANPNYSSSNLGTSVNPAFAGGTLLIDQAGQTYSNTFTLDDTPTNTIEMNGNTTVLSGSFSDSSAGTPGVITYTDADGGGQVTLTGASTYTGSTTLNSGTLALAGSATLGADTASTIVNGGTLELGGTSQTQAALAQSGGTVQNGTIAVGTYTLTGGTLAADAIVDAGSAIDVHAGTVEGTLTGTAGLTKPGAGTITLAGANSYTGGTVVDDGALVLAGAGTLGSTAGDTIVNGGELDLGGTSQTQAALTQNGGTLQNGTIAVGTYTLTGGTLAADAIVDAGSGITVQAGSVDGTLAGAAGLSKSGAGTVTLAGANSYTGGTVVDDGALVLTGSGTLGSTVGETTVNGGALDLGSTSQTQAALMQNGGTVQNGSIAVGTYTLTGGALAADAIVDAGSGIAVQAGLVDGTLAGAAGLIKSGAGTVTLAGAASYTGGTIIDDGALVLAGAGRLGSTVGETTVNGGALDLGGTSQTQATLTQNGGTVQNGTITVGTYTLAGGALATDATVDAGSGIAVQAGSVDGTLAGAAGLTKSGADTVTLAGTNSYTGGTIVDGEALVLAEVGTLGATAGETTVNGGALDLGSTSQTQAALTQNGGIVQNGTIAAGTYTLTGGTLAADASVVAGNAIAVQAGSVDGTLAGAAGLTKSGTAVVTLAGANSYSGGTVVDGGTLALTGAGTLGSTTGETTINAGRLDLGDTSQVQATLLQNGGTVQNGTIAIGTYTLTDGVLAANSRIDANGAIDIEAGTVNGILTGTAGLTKTSSNGVVLAGANTFTGGVTVDGGTLALKGAGTLGSATGTTTINRGTLDLGGTSQTQASLTQGGATVQNGTLALDSYTILSGTLSSDVAATVRDTIEVQSGMVDGTLLGSASLTKTSGNMATLTAANSYTGGTTVNDGLLVLAGNGAIISSLTMSAQGGFSISNANGDRTLTTVTGLGNIDLGANTLVLTQATGAYGGQITGTGGLVLSAAQGYALNGLNTFSGGVSLLTGTLSLGDSSALGTGTLAMSEFTAIGLASDGMVIGNAITVSGDPTIDVATGLTATIAGTISDGTQPGDIVKTGGGTLIFTGNNTYSAGTTISGGTLQLGDGGTSGSIIGDVVNNATLAFDRSDAVTFAGIVTGTGTIVQGGTGSTTLTAANTYSGGTFISSGTLVGSVTSFGSGAILDNAGLVINQTSDASFANAINGSGTFTKQGAGILTLTGTSGLSGTTNVAQGELVVTGSLRSSRVALAGGTRLSGTGTVGGIAAAAGSTIAPGGNAVGTLSVNGNVSQQANATYAVQVTAGTTLSDRIVASGAATLDTGAILAVAKTNVATRYALGGRFTVLTAAGGVTGTYTLTGDTAVSAFYDLVVDYDANNVYLDVNQTSSFASAAITPNQRSVAGALDALSTTVGLRNALGFVQTYEEARAAFGQLSGEIHSSAKSALIQDSQYLRDAVSARLRSGSGGDKTARPGVSIWGNGYGSWGTLAGDGNAGVLHRSARGLLVGADVALGDTSRIGVLGGYSRSKFHTAGHRDSGDSDNYHAGVYAGTDLGPVNLQVGAAYTWHKLDFDRSVAFTGFSDALASRYDGNSAQAFGEAGYRIDVRHGYFQPFVQASYVRLHTDGFTESGGNAALIGRSKTTEVTFANLGLRGNVDVARAGALRFAWSTAWRHAFSNRTPFTDMRFGAGTQVFGIAGTPIAKNAAALQAGIEASPASGVSLGVSYSGQIGSNVQDHGIKGNLTWRF
jgi:outer membrane autotransporter protein